MIPTLHISLLGEFLLVSGDTPVTTVDWPRLHSMLAYLMLHHTASQSRTHLAFLLWPDSTDVQAHTNLRHLVYRLRRDLPYADYFLHADKQTLRWRPDAPWTLDVADFERAITQAEQVQSKTETRKALETAIELYHGDLLPGNYDEWILPERERLRQLFLSALERLILLLEQERDYPSAISYAQRLLGYDPLHEATYRHLMRLYAVNGERATAIRVYHACTTVLDRELAVEPSRATREVYEQLLQKDSPSVPPASPSATLVTEVPLVGRQHEWSQLQMAWQNAVAGEPHLLVLSGEAGIGKTRLAEELLTWVGRQGMTTASARCYAPEGELAYAPVTSWLRTDALRTPLGALADTWLTEVARFVPSILTDRPDLPHPGPLIESWQRQHLFEALARAILGARQPLLLLLDDLQWCDRETLEWLHYLLRSDPHARMLILGTLRPEEMTSKHPLTSLLAALHSSRQVTEIMVGPLNAIDTAALASQVTRRPLAPYLVADLYKETEGNPLFIVETVRMGIEETRDTEYPSKAESHSSKLPPTVQAVIEARLEQLSPQALDVVSLAATIGRAFTFPVLVRASSDDEDALVRGLDELWQRRIVREQGVDAYDFSHDKLREVAYAALSSARRRLLHHRVFEALHAVDAPAAQLAQHALAARLFEPAFRFSVAAGDQARRLFARREARMHYMNALDCLSHLPVTTQNPRRHVDTALKKVNTPFSPQAPKPNLVQLSEVEALVKALSNTEEADNERRLSQARVHFWMGRMHYYHNDRRKALGCFQSMLAEAQELGDEELIAISSSVTSRILVHQGYFIQARPLLVQAITALERAANWTEYIDTIGYLGIVLAGRGEYRVGVEAVQRALKEHGLTADALCHCELTMMYILGGETQRALEESRAIVSVGEQAGDRFAVYLGHGMQAWVETRLGHHEQALAHMIQQQATGASLGEERLVIEDTFAAVRAEIALNAGRIEEALALAEEAVAYAQTMDGKFAEGLAQRTQALALVAFSPPRWEAARVHIAASLQAFEAGEILLEMARTHQEWARLCRVHHGLLEARFHMEQAAAKFEACGLLEERERLRNMIVDLE
jgi:DNA-binding SARP family transcriptional activator